MEDSNENRFLETIIEKAKDMGSLFIIASSVTLNRSILYCSVQFSEKIKLLRTVVLKNDAYLDFIFGKQTNIHSIKRYKEAIDLNKKENVEMVLYDASGFKAWYLVSTIPVFNCNLEPTLILIFFNEIGHLKKSLNELESPKTKWRNIARRVMAKNKMKLENNNFDKKKSLEEMTRFYEEMFIPFYGREKVKLPRYVISQDHTLKKCWDSFMLFIIVYTAIVLPFSICFRKYTKILKVFDTVFDMAFLVDIGLTFFTTYVDKKGVLVTDLKKIKSDYLKGWFPLHTVFGLSCLTSSFFYNERNSIYVVQALILIRLLRLTFAPKKLVPYLDSNIFTLVLWMFIFLICAHWLACIWYLIGFQIDVVVKQNSHGWLSYLMLIEYSYDGMNVTTLIADGKGPPIANCYVTALYFVVTILSTCGFGNLGNSPNTLTEKMFTIIAMVFGCVLYAFIFGKVNNIIAQLYHATNKYSAQLNAIQHFIKTYKVPNSIGSRLKDYFIATWTVTKGVNQDRIMNRYPRDLQSDLCLCIHKKVLEKEPCFKNMSKEAQRSVSRFFWVLRTPPGDILVSYCEMVDSIYFVISGAFEVNCNEELIGLIGPGDSFGQRLVAKPEKSTCEVKSTSYGIVHSINVDGLLKALAIFPEELNKMKYTLKLSVDITKKIQKDRYKVKEVILNNWVASKSQLADISLETENQDESTSKLKPGSLLNVKIQKLPIELNKKVAQETFDVKTKSVAIKTQTKDARNVIIKKFNKVTPELANHPIELENNSNELNCFRNNTDKYFFANGDSSV
ncbi:potassium voltage-gated channel subfamily H member 2 isoform X2 [Hydra vulgaris]|uniref:Potassium voltage-gated channel subfamily H member 2 isoform X2 n=1 Tax=Hydra vulgaris TaxID=6087 RepID=A0ABM4CJ46_HYDVU